MNMSDRWREIKVRLEFVGASKNKEKGMEISNSGLCNPEKCFHKIETINGNKIY
jgi:hypothetical protein